jgi:hypothetical protein
LERAFISRVFIFMQLFSYIFTDLMSFSSPSEQVWIDKDDLFGFASRVAREMLAAVPDLTNKGMCVAIYDKAGQAISYVPLDSLH